MRSAAGFLILAIASPSIAVEAQQFDGTTESARRRAVAPPAPVPSSDALIDKALSQGKIDPETALKYQVFAAFGDCRLPNQFRGDDSNVFDTLILDEVAARFSTLSAATQSVLLPYLREPYEDDGWLNARATACGSGKASAVPATAVITLLDGKVTIRYRPQDQQVAQAIATAVVPIWTKLSSLMGREPKEYQANGKLRVNINVVEITASEEGVGRLGTTSFKIPSGGTIPCKFAPSFINVDPRGRDIPATVAHELMHAFQNAFDVKTSCVAPEYKWWKEATATWAQDSKTFPPPPPGGDTEHPYAEGFFSVPEQPLDCLDSGKCKFHEYGAYVLPFYIAGRYGDPQFVKRSWESAAGNLSLDAVNAALAPYGGFEKEWAEFARFNYNRDPVDDYENWDSLGPGGNRAKEEYENVDLAGDDNVYKMQTTIDGSKKALTLEPLSAQYFHFVFTDDNVRSLAFINGATFKLSLKTWAPVPEWGNLYVLDDVGEDARKGAKVQALLKINGAWENAPRDWTDTPYVPFCRATPAENVEEMVIIYSNSEYRDRKKIQAADLTPILFVSNMGCAGWKTESASFDDKNAPIHVEWNATFKRIIRSAALGRAAVSAIGNEGLPVLGFDYEGTGTTSFRAQGTLAGCTLSGSGSVPLAYADLYTWNFVPPEAELHRLYWGFMDANENLGTITATCSGGTSMTMQPPLAWSVFPKDRNRVPFGGSTITTGKSEALDMIGRYEWTIVLDENP